MIHRTIYLALLLWFTTPVTAQEFETEVYPSEDELLEALERGEIDPDLFLILQEIYLHGIDSASLHLLDQLPNASYFRNQDRRYLSALEARQIEFLHRREGTGQPHYGWMRYRFQQRLEQKEQSRWLTSGEIELDENTRFDFQLRREFSGNERFISRSISYNSSEKQLRELIVGNFSRRFGLGTIFGHRGKLLDFSERLEAESILYPDYGGYNGVFARIELGTFESKLLVSVNRDSAHTINSAGAMFSPSRKWIIPSVTLGITRVKSRSSGETADDIKMGVTFEHDYSDGAIDMEIVLQSGATNSFALAAEGTHYAPQYRISYALWSYDNKFNDLTGGSKTSRIIRTVQIKMPEFYYSSRRAGQKGVLIKTQVQLTSNLDMENSLLLGHRNNDSLNFQLLSGLTRMIGEQSNIRFDYLHRLTKRIGELLDRSVRIELNLLSSGLRSRYYVRYRSREKGSDYFSLFANINVSSESGDWEVWGNLGEISAARRQLDYFYGYLANRQFLGNGISWQAKLSRRYRRSASEKHLTTLSIELETRW